MITEFGKALGQRLKGCREAKGLTQAQLAMALGKSVETVSNFERGRTLPSLLTLNSLAEKLGVPLTAFFDADEQIPTQAGKISKAARTIRNSADVLPEDDLEILAGLVRVLEGRNH